MTNENVEPTPSEEPAFGEAPPQARTLLGNKTYDRLKFVAQVGLPALAVFYASIGGAWEIPHTDKVVVTLMALDLFLGVLLGLATRQYETSGAKYSGVVHLRDVTLEDGETRGKEVGIGFKDGVDGQQIEQQKEVTFKVIND